MSSRQDEMDQKASTKKGKVSEEDRRTDTSMYCRRMDSKATEQERCGWLVLELCMKVTTPSELVVFAFRSEVIYSGKSCTTRLQ